MGSLGDVVRGLTVADAIKAQHPDTHITWIIEPKCREMAELSKSIDELIVFQRGKPLGFLRLIYALLMRRFDVTLDMQRHFKSGIISFLSRAPRRIGFHRSNSKEGNWIFQTATIPAEDKNSNKFLMYRHFASALGLNPPLDARLSLRISRNAHEGAYVFIVMGSSWHSKNWVREGYSRLVRDLRTQGYECILVGGRGDSELADQVLADINDPKVRSLCGRTTLAELIGIIKGAAVGIGPDSGPGHLAAAVGVPYVSLFGPTEPRRVAPVGYDNLVVTSAVGCAPCYKRVCPGLNKICMRLISVPKILEKVRLAVEGSAEKR